MVIGPASSADLKVYALLLDAARAAYNAPSPGRFRCPTCNADGDEAWVASCLGECDPGYAGGVSSGY